MANKVKFGLRNVYYAKATISGGTYTYDTPVALNGAVSLSTSATGERTPFYADDIEYFVSNSNQGYEGELEVALLTDAFKTDILGMTADNNGALVENADDTPSHFALGFEVQGDDTPRRVWFYDCTASRPTDAANTKEATTTPQTDTLPLTISPRSSDRAVKVVMTKTQANETAFNGFFSQVYEAQ